MYKFITRPDALTALFCMLLALLLPATAVAATSEQPPVPITITSNSAEFARNEDISTYTDDVVLTRGGLTLNGDKLVVKRLSDGTFRAELTGAPVTIHRKPQDKEDEPVN